MSQSDVDWFQGRMITDYVACAIVALTVYEYALMFKDELALWRRKRTTSTWLFLINRYLMIIVAIVQFAPYIHQVGLFIYGHFAIFDRSSDRCDGTLEVLLLVQLLPYAVTAVFSGLRVYAFCDGNLVLSGLVVFLSVVPIPVNAYLTFRLSTFSEHDTPSGTICITGFNITPRHNFYVTLGIRLAVITADLMVLAATWRKTYHLYQFYKSPQSIRKMGLGTILLRDGSLYFIALFVMNVAQILVKGSVSYAAVVLRNPVADIIDVMQAILVCRFIVDLRYTDIPEESVNATPSSKLSIQFLRGTSSHITPGDMGQYFDYGRERGADEGGIEIN